MPYGKRSINQIRFYWYVCPTGKQLGQANIQGWGNKPAKPSNQTSKTRQTNQPNQAKCPAGNLEMISFPVGDISSIAGVMRKSVFSP